MDVLTKPVRLRDLQALLDVNIQPRFRLPECGKTGTLLGLGPGGARVKYDGSDQEVEIEEEESTGRKKAKFVRPGRPITISDACVVEVL